MKDTKRLAMIGLLCALATACAPPISEVQNYNATYACGAGRIIHVRFSTGAAVLESDGRSIAMNQQRTADGFLYAGGGHSLRGRGFDATWKDGKGAVHQCHDGAAAKAQ